MVRRLVTDAGAWVLGAAAVLACSSAGGGPGDLGVNGGSAGIIDPGASGGADAQGGTAATGGSGSSVAVGGTAQTGGTAGSAGGEDDTPTYCGDGLVNRGGEVCDDGNAVSGDGCTAECDQLEANYACPTPGMPCVSTVRCGDGRVTGTETCDDTTQAPVAGDGCDESCQLEAGYVCPVSGAACRPICGDGLILGRQQCDDANATPGDGCDENCVLEPGWVCPEAEPCRVTVCGDEVVEGSEQCDDGNAQPYDGCAPDCTKEPSCGTATDPVGKCVSTCGDSILLVADGEECDDGNALADDGCSADCKLESGFECTTLVDEPPPFIDLPIVIRDFHNGGSNGGHPDFGPFCCNVQTGIVLPLLGADRKPVYAGTNAAPIGMTSGSTAFDQWYRDVDGVSPDGTNLRFDRTIRLLRNASGAYEMNSATDMPWAALDPPGFFPIDELGFGNEYLSHNYSLTSELRYWFEFKGNEILNFSGDDDVWVFVNGHLAVDLGGVHDRQYGTVAFDAAGHGQSCTGQTCTPAGDVDFAMQVGDIYETVVFQAERHPGDSNYWLTLTNFLAGKSRCTPVCGDGVVTRDEACDLGAANNDGAHGGCNPDCTLAVYCGDGHVDPGEACDDGANTSIYGGCAPGCVPGPTCGDGSVQAPFEECDDGVNDGGYRECNQDCQYGARCGDGKVEPGVEECDDGEGNGKNGNCRADCTLIDVR